MAASYRHTHIPYTGQQPRRQPLPTGYVPHWTTALPARTRATRLPRIKDYVRLQLAASPVAPEVAAVSLAAREALAIEVRLRSGHARRAIVWRSPKL